MADAIPVTSAQLSLKNKNENSRSTGNSKECEGILKYFILIGRFWWTITLLSKSIQGRNDTKKNENSKV